MDLEIEEGGSPDVPDGGLPPGADGGPGVDPGSGGGGCGCTATNDAGTGALPVLAVFGFLWLSRRRRQV
jgi:uncharacterized protein (TIGR03382 family)